MTKEILPGRMMNRWCVYMVSRSNGLYVGMTSDLQNRLRQHGRTALLYAEFFSSREQAAQREREVKGWSNKKKRDLIIRFSRHE